jgi:maltose operon substrate-binding protein precursor MalM
MPNALRGLAALLPALLAACATPAVPPILSLDARPCVGRPDLAAAQALPLDAGKPIKLDLDAGAACLESGVGGRSAYVAFRLPRSEQPYLLTVLSAPLGDTLFAPRLMLLDEQGKVLREVPRDDFTFHGVALYAGLRAAPAERYLIVASDPLAVGQHMSHIIGESRMTPVPVGIGGVFLINSGSEKQQVITYAHNGRVTVTAQPMPKAN